MKKWRCTVCGQVFEGDAPPVPCPVCGAGESAFELVEETGPAQWRCTVCGQVFEGDAPPVPCPVCGAGESAFERVDTAQSDYHKDTGDEFVLIGGGVAALAAARAIRKRNSTASITMVLGEQHRPYNRPGLSDVLADGLSFANLELEEESFYEANGIRLLLGTKAESIDTGEKLVKLSQGEPLRYSKLLIATGANAFNPIKTVYRGIPVYVLRCFEDAEVLAKEAAGKRVVLVGGGILGLEAALALHGRGAKVTVVELAERILPLQADDAASQMLRKKLESMDIRVLTSASVTAADERGAVLNTGEVLEADLVLASLGVRSDVGLAVAIGLELSRGIVVDEHMHTSHEDIWAAGDCAEFGGRVLAMVGAASAMGEAAGASMAGDESVPYKPFIPATALSFPGFSLFSVGAVAEDADESLCRENVRTGNYRRLFFKAGKLQAAVFVGENPGAKAVKALAAGEGPEKAVSLLL